jgi:hypothetical protein
VDRKALKRDEKRASGGWRQGIALAALTTLLALFVFPASARADKLPFGVTVFGGASAAGGIYSATSSQGDFLWLSPEGEEFGGERLKATLDENVFFGLRAGAGFADQWSWNLSVARTKMNVTADILTAARNSDAYSWDTAHGTFFEAALQWDWTKQSNTPYFLAGIGTSKLTFLEREDNGDDLKQSGVSYVLGGGYRWEFVRFEVRDHLLPTDFSDEGKRLGAETFDGKDLLQIWEISVGFFMGF